MPTKKLIKIIGASLLATLGFTTYKYINRVPTVDYPGDFEGKIDDEDISLKRYGLDMTSLEISNVSPGKTTGHFTSYHDNNNNGTVNFYNYEFQQMPLGGGILFGYSRKFVDPIVSQRRTKEGKEILLKDQKTYNNYLVKISQIISKKKE
ncbi:MAG: hypothetical protein AABW90_03145 [Nanoarchaeota archaeon]